jgi:two-component system, NarL family, nitrate/nitrite response regulator NarL
MPPFKALIVEDFEDFRQFLYLTLQERAEFRVIGQASDGLEAVKQAEELQPDLVLLPTLNGIEVCWLSLKWRGDVFR